MVDKAHNPPGTVRLKNAGAGDGVLRFALREAAEWLVDAGYPFDFTLTDEPPPPAFLLAIIDAVHADRSGTLHGRDLDWQTCAEWVASEARWRSDNGCPWCYQADTECGRPECLAHGGMLHPNKAPASGEIPAPTPNHSTQQRITNESEPSTETSTGTASEKTDRG